MAASQGDDCPLAIDEKSMREFGLFELLSLVHNTSFAGFSAAPSFLPSSAVASQSLTLAGARLAFIASSSVGLTYRMRSTRHATFYAKPGPGPWSKKPPDEKLAGPRRMKSDAVFLDTIGVDVERNAAQLTEAGCESVIGRSVPLWKVFKFAKVFHILDDTRPDGRG